MMTEEQIQEFVDRQFSRPRINYGEDQMIEIIDFKTRKLTDEKNRKEIKRLQKKSNLKHEISI